MQATGPLTCAPAAMLASRPAKQRLAKRFFQIQMCRDSGGFFVPPKEEEE